MDINRHIRRKLGVRWEVPPFVGITHSSREETLPGVFTDLGYKIGAEIGVRRGEYSKVLLEKVPDLKLYCIDPWTVMSRTYNEYRQNRNREITFAALAEYNAEILVKTSEEALKDIPDGHLDFVYIDGLHDFNNIMYDIIGWSRKVRSGGIVSGHDYFYYQGVGVIFAVNAYVQAHGINQWFITRESLPGTPSWFWVKP